MKYKELKPILQIRRLLRYLWSQRGLEANQIQCCLGQISQYVSRGYPKEEDFHIVEIEGQKMVKFVSLDC